MTNHELLSSLREGDPTQMLAVAWNQTELTLAERADIISELHLKSRLTIDGTARMAGVSAAHIKALLDLASLDDADLQRVSDANPPATTWFLFGSAESDAINAGIEALNNH